MAGRNETLQAETGLETVAAVCHEFAMVRSSTTFITVFAALWLASCATAPPKPAPLPPSSPLPSVAPPAAAAPQPQPAGSFADWLNSYRAAAQARGISPATLDNLFAGMTASERVIALDRAQPGDSGTAPARFDTYLARHLDASRVSGGQQSMAANSAALASVLAKNGVPAGVIIGILGMESSYGKVTGDFDVVRSLATLAWEGRRRSLFSKELDAAVDIVNRGLATRSQLRGSWAGAMGQPQFLPSSFLNYAVDGDGDGRRDIWGSDADVIASIGNYLARNGWQPGIGWGIAVTPPPGFARETVRNPEKPKTCVRPLERHSRWLPASEWQAMGFTSSATWPAAGTPMSLVEPDGAGQGAYLTTASYRAILAYNCSNFYALSVALLGDAVANPTP